MSPDRIDANFAQLQIIEYSLQAERNIFQMIEVIIQVAFVLLVLFHAL
jgi:hypothetical protein